MRQAHRQHAGAIAALASIFIVLPLLPANAAEANGTGDAALTATASTGADKNGLREPSAGGPLIIRGTRPEIPKVERDTAVTGVPPAPVVDTTYGFPVNLGFQPALAGNGWNAQYDYRGFDLPVTPR